jgi:hypothetical protein
VLKSREPTTTVNRYDTLAANNNQVALQARTSPDYGLPLAIPTPPTIATWPSIAMNNLP